MVEKENNKDNNIFNKFSKHLKMSLVKAQDLALALHKKEVDIWEILYALSIERGSAVFNLLSHNNFRAGDFKTESIKAVNIEKKNNFHNSKTIIPQFSKRAQKLIEKSVKIAYQKKHAYIGTEHFLLAVLNSNFKDFDLFLKQKNIDKNVFLEDVKNLVLNASKLSDLMNDDFSNIDILEKMLMGKVGSESNSGPSFTMELTSAEIQEKIDPVIGRQKEINRLIQVLSRRTKNNPILLGDPGVGKTAIIEGLAKRIFENKVPDVLLGKKIISLDLGAVIAGTMYRGEFEKRLKKIIDEAKRDDNIILFIDEIHTLVGAGAGTGQLDAANLLKPELAKGDLKVIGATTVQEYRKYIESDPAFERRFQAILVNEPTVSETQEIIQGLRINYEKYHNVKISDEAIQTAIKLSQRYLPEKFLPDKAIDLIDEAASKFKVKNLKNSRLKKNIQLKNILLEITDAKDRAIDTDNYEKAISLKEKEDQIIKKLEILNKNTSQTKKVLGEITKDHIAEIISKITNIPVEELMSSEKKKFMRLEKILNKKIIGQKEVIQDISEYIRRAKAGLANPNKPLGSFMFLGPSGVGKTETAKVLAREVYNDEKALIRIDMSEFSEKFDVSKLIGAPAGYVGYRDSNKFIDQVRTRPYSIILFDEIEKAHPDIFNLLLPILEDGYITDSSGKVINFKNTIIIMTSNIGNEQFNKHASLGFDIHNQTKKNIIEEEYSNLKTKVVNSLNDYFKPEFLNRLDKIFVFNPLNIDDMSKITKLEIKKLKERLLSKNIFLEVDKKIYKYIALNSFDPRLGARPLRRYIQDYIENLIANEILSDKVKNGTNIVIYLDKRKIKMKLNN